MRAPGVLESELPAAALYDRAVALDASLRNLLRRAGYRDLDAVRDEGHEAGRAEGRAAGLEQGRAEVFARLIERRLKRALTGDEAAALQARLREQGPDEVEALVLDAPREDLSAWLAKASR